LPFTFANAHVGKTGFTYPAGFERFLTDYEMDEATWKSFLEHAAKSDAKLTQEQLDAERAYIGRTLKREIAGNVWGPTERYRVLLASDPVLKQARTLFPQANELLALTAKDDGQPGTGASHAAPVPRTAKN
jgi:hypothetical protein